MKNLINIIKNQQVFVTLEQEEEYCRKNKIHIKRLENGITIIGITREVSDLVKAGIEFIFFQPDRILILGGKPESII